MRTRLEEEAYTKAKLDIRKKIEDRVQEILDSTTRLHHLVLYKTLHDGGMRIVSVEGELKQELSKEFRRLGLLG